MITLPNSMFAVRYTHQMPKELLLSVNRYL